MESKLIATKEFDELAEMLIKDGYAAIKEPSGSFFPRLYTTKVAVIKGSEVSFFPCFHITNDVKLAGIGVKVGGSDIKFYRPNMKDGLMSAKRLVSLAKKSELYPFSSKSLESIRTTVNEFCKFGFVDTNDSISADNFYVKLQAYSANSSLLFNRLFDLAGPNMPQRVFGEDIIRFTPTFYKYDDGSFNVDRLDIVLNTESPINVSAHEMRDKGAPEQFYKLAKTKQSWSHLSILTIRSIQEAVDVFAKQGYIDQPNSMSKEVFEHSLLVDVSDRIARRIFGRIPPEEPVGGRYPIRKFGNDTVRYYPNFMIDANNRYLLLNVGVKINHEPMIVIESSAYNLQRAETLYRLVKGPEIKSAAKRNVTAAKGRKRGPRL